MIQTSEPFTKELLDKHISTGKNVIFSYPAGSGKTTAIRDYIVDQIKSKKINRKLIYVAPTKSLLDEMYVRLLEAGLTPDIIFNYHSSSTDYKNCCTKNFLQNIRYKIETSIIILITHERMKFDAAEKFIDRLDFKTQKPLIFLDESIEDCNVAGLYSRNLTQILRVCGLIDRTETQRDYKEKDRMPIIDAKKIYHCFIEPNEKNQLCHLKELGIELADPIGFSEEADISNEQVKLRFLNLYSLIAMAIAEGNWLENSECCFIKVPIAIHEAWKDYAQVIITDATAFINACVCQNFDLTLSTAWNAQLLSNYVKVSKKYTRTQLEKNWDLAIEFLDEINLRKYSKIYVVTFKNKMMDSIYKYLKQSYPEYNIEFFEPTEAEKFVATDIDSTTDELYTDSHQEERIIYLANFGCTRGSNKFRECDCVIQIGDYRLNPHTIQCLSVVYPELTSNKLALVNYIQELYRGRIRCNQKMDSYSMIDDSFYKYMQSAIEFLHFKFTEYDSEYGYEPVLTIREPYSKYGINQDLVRFLYMSKYSGRMITKQDLMKVCGLSRWDKTRKRLLNLYRKYETLRKEVFINFPTLPIFEKALHVENNGLNTSDIALTL